MQFPNGLLKFRMMKKQKNWVTGMFAQQMATFYITVVSMHMIVVLSPALLFPYQNFNPLNAELNPICYLLALLRAHHFLHVSRIRVKYVSAFRHVKGKGKVIPLQA